MYTGENLIYNKDYDAFLHTINMEDENSGPTHKVYRNEKQITNIAFIICKREKLGILKRTLYGIS